MLHKGHLAMVAVVVCPKRARYSNHIAGHTRLSRRCH